MERTIKAKSPEGFLIGSTIFLVVVWLIVTWGNLPRHPDVLYTKPLSNSEKEYIRSRMWYDYDRMVRWGYVDPYYGTINDCIVFVVIPFGTPKPEPWSQKIAGYTFAWDSPIEIFVYRKNSQQTIRTLYEAWYVGWLTDEHIGTLYRRHNEYREEFPQMLEEWKKSREENEDS